MLEARGLTKYYSAIPAVRDVSFRIAPGGVLGILGPNGSGKSTTVSIVTGLLEPSGGAVYYNGQDIRNDLLGYKAQIGYVPEEAILYTHLTGPGSIVARRPAPRPVGCRDSPAHGWLPQNLRSPGRRGCANVGVLKGMRQKILISAALLHDPAVVVLDEPNSGLDVTTTLVLRSLIQALAAEGRIVVYSSHVLESVEQVASDVVILLDGRVVAHDSIARLRELMQAPSLESVFRTLVIETDIDRVAHDLVDVMRA